MNESSFFKVGGRYRNRIGWYEVLEVKNNTLRLRFEDNNEEKWANDLVILKRIWDNIQNEESISKPYKKEASNSLFFKTIGYLVKHSFIEAIIPQKSKDGFDANYFRIKGKKPGKSMRGYYIHNDYEVDKWGTEMRLTFDKPNCDLDFGKMCNIVKSPEENKLRINSNNLCYDLLNRGFDLGDKQDIHIIESKIPDNNLKDFREGLNI
jgi:hypothetical protein